MYKVGSQQEVCREGCTEDYPKLQSFSLPARITNATVQQSWVRATPLTSSALKGRLHVAKGGKCLLDHKKTSCCSPEWYEQENEVV